MTIFHLKIQNMKRKKDSDDHSDRENQIPEIQSTLVESAKLNNTDDDSIENYSIEDTIELDCKKSRLIKKQKAFQDAVEDFTSGRSTSIRQASRKFGIPYTTLYDVFISGGKFKGSGTHSTVLTKSEEKKIAIIALGQTNEGKDLTWPKLKEIMMDEMDAIKSEDPRRDMCKVSATFGSLLNMSFVRRFAERNGLSKYLLKRFTVPTRPHECKRCGFTFSWKNALVKHIRIDSCPRKIVKKL